MAQKPEIKVEKAIVFDSKLDANVKKAAKSGGEDAYHVFVGGGFGNHQAVGRQVFAGVKAKELPNVLETMLRTYLKYRQGSETFKTFTTRFDVKQLQEYFDEANKR